MIMVRNDFIFIMLGEKLFLSLILLKDLCDILKSFNDAESKKVMGSNPDFVFHLLNSRNVIKIVMLGAVVSGLSFTVN